MASSHSTPTLVDAVHAALSASPVLVGDVARTHARLVSLGVGRAGLLQVTVPMDAIREGSQALIDDLAALTAAGMSLGARTTLHTGELTPAGLQQLLSEVWDVTEHNPMPELEWPVLRPTMTDELLAALLDVSPQSIRRYATGERDTPDDIAARLHFVALVNADIAGSYNDRGIRRWWARPRAVLDARSPLDVLTGGFDPDGPVAAQVRGLAGALVGPGGAS